MVFNFIFQIKFIVFVFSMVILVVTGIIVVAIVVVILIIIIITLSFKSSLLIILIMLLTMIIMMIIIIVVVIIIYYNINSSNSCDDGDFIMLLRINSILVFFCLVFSMDLHISLMEIFLRLFLSNYILQRFFFQVIMIFFLFIYCHC